MKDGVFRQYRGARDKDSFISFVEDKKWTQIEEVSSWKDPSSLQMTMVSYFFKLSMVLRNVHTTLTEEYQVNQVHSSFIIDWSPLHCVALYSASLLGVLCGICHRNNSTWRNSWFDPGLLHWSYISSKVREIKRINCRLIQLFKQKGRSSTPTS